MWTTTVTVVARGGLRSRLAYFERMAARPGSAAMCRHLSLKEDDMTKLFTYAGIAASVILIAFGVGAIYTGFDGRDQVRGDLAREQIVGTDDSTIPGQKVDTGTEAQAFAAVIRKHTLEATGGQTYSQMGRFLDENGKATSDEKLAATDPKTGQPVENGLRDMWVTSTALSTSLNTAYFAERVATFAIVMGFALLLTGIGFLVLTVRLLVPRTASAKAPIASAVPVPS
jgi:putative Mn2+ efflux pump MntP